ncbi:MAG: HNH endonuclease domain-containing protein [Niabella sp.]
METKKVLGLDIGTNSIGAALITLPKEYSDYGKQGKIEWLGSRIIPTDGDYLRKFESGAQAETKAAFRRGKRGSRRLKHRYKLRRTRLIKVFKALGWIDETFPLDEPKRFKKDINENGYALKISDYLPFSEETINEFEKELGIESQKSKKGKSVVPEDWIVYFLRKKALARQITTSELVRIIYVLNQRRGFKSSRKDLKENTSLLQYEDFWKIKKDIQNSEYETKEYETQFVSISTVVNIDLVSNEKDKKGNYKFSVNVSDERVCNFDIQRRKMPEWKGKEFTFLITQKIKKGKFEQLQPKTPTANDWGLCTTALDEKINNYQTPGEYFYEQIKAAYLTKRNFKARQFPVYRKRYQEELATIWHKQCELNPELAALNKNQDILTKLAGILYPTQAKNNMPKLKEFQSKDLLYIISNDIIYYQRELKSQKNAISECRYEKRKGIDGELYGVKCVPRSSPLFQEFRIWQDIHNIRILKREEKVDGKTKLDIDVTSQYINEIVKEKLFDLFNAKASISEKDILNSIKVNNEQTDIATSNQKEGEHSHRINLFANRDSLKGNETLLRYRSVFNKTNYDGETILNNPEKLLKLWHIDYSISSSDEEKSRKGITTALSKLLPNADNKTQAIETFCKLAELKKEYGSYSACAIKKLLPVMRCGKYWTESAINNSLKERIKKLITAEFDERISNDTRKKIQKWERENNKPLSEISHFMGLPTWLAGYVVYGIHSEKEKMEIKNVEDYSTYIQKAIANNSVGNPIVEQVVRETMFLVRDLWKKYGDIDEIHIELGRELKNNSIERERISKAQTSNFNEKQRIKKLLYELLNGFEQCVDENDEKPFEFENGKFKWKTKEKSSKFEINPNPESPVDIDKFRIYKSCGTFSKKEDDEKLDALFKDGKKEKIPTNAEVRKYALWLSQNCRSPYTGKIIPLSKLFDINQYEIEHIIPRAKMKNDSFNNLVISEWGVNKAKDKSLAANFISNSKGECKHGDTKYKLFTYEEYEAHCKETFKFQKSKLKNLLAIEVPDDFIERQLNDTRHIGRKLAELLAPVAKNENGILFSGGGITSELKNNWGLNKVWKEIILQRFERLEAITGKKGEYVIHSKDEHENPVIHLNVKENPKLDTKRIDHRHHALDALIIAATTREHIRYLNTLNAADTDEEIKKYRQSLVKGKIRDFKEPWNNFTKDARGKLEEVIVSFKTNNKIISQPKNRTTYYNAELKKVFKEQKTNPKWMAVRRSMFKEPLGVIWVKEIKEVSVLEAFSIHIERKLANSDKEKRKTAPYIYDKQARLIIDDIVSKSNFAIDEQEQLLKDIKILLEKNSKKIETGKTNKNGKAQTKTVYVLNRVEYEKIKVAHFVSYKTKRMALTKTDYVEKLTIEKMKGDFPYFSFVSADYFNSLPQDKQAIIKNSKLEISANRKPNAFNQLFLEHILEYDNNSKEAFSAEGVEKLNKKAIETPKIGKEIKSVTRLDGTVDIDDMFNGGFYETDKGAMAYFVMYEDQKTKDREYLEPNTSIATHKAIEKIVKGEPIAEDRDGFDKIILSPGDLVYVPTIEERGKIVGGNPVENSIDWKDCKHLVKRIYKVVSFSKKDLLCIKANIADYIIPYDRKEKSKGEIGWDNKSTATMEDDFVIKDVCIKLNIDRLGNISLQKNNPARYETNTNILAEPEVIYETKKHTLQKFDSFEEMNEADAKSAAETTPLEHLKQTTELIKQVYAKELENPSDKKIKFR